MSGTDYTEEELRLSELKIEKGIPLRERYPHGKFSELANQMEIGDSIFCLDDRQLNGIAQRLVKTGKRYETRKEGRGRRIWRVK